MVQEGAPNMKHDEDTILTAGLGEVTAVVMQAAIQDVDTTLGQLGPGEEELALVQQGKSKP